MSDVHVNSTAHALCGSHAFRHNFQLLVAERCALCRKFLVSLESHDRHSLLVDTMPPVIDRRRIHQSLRCPHSPKYRGLRSGDRTGQLTGPPRPIRSSQKRSGSGAV
jgi:hypothetical protein